MKIPDIFHFFQSQHHKRINSSGFTLLEVMIALAVFAVASAALITATGQNVRQSAYLENRTLAAQVARNAMEEVLSQPQWPSTGVSSEEVSMAGRKWEVLREVEATDSPHLRRIEITVSASEGHFMRFDSPRLAHLVGFKGEF
ncbi:type II secretion system minor pseudopilin GspI [Desulfurispira natronophila]|uniref:Type II secretion system protein I n=1 Tax=Desulfurispira natronophila TaxID=682562 RepID=A0A7W7Y332_9BACT|nr:type II secretion system minor pseudopilin GspI [Desulfurispira natronophila]MBB5020892.1 general secretion pathway protein I [Desulfurispira natronophila]